VALAIEIINTHLSVEGPPLPILHGLQADLGSVLTEAEPFSP
jgi:hypothetical protein